MSNPPEINLDARTNTQRLHDDITTALTEIRELWPDAMPEIIPGRRIGNSPSGGGAHAEDDAETETDIDTLTRALAARQNALGVLKSWCNLVVEERPITNRTSRPNVLDAVSMSRFLEIHAEWISWHDIGHEAPAELNTIKRRLAAITPPSMTRDEYLENKPAERWFIGRCPLPKPTNDAQPQPEAEELVICDGKVYAYPDDEDGRALNQYERRRDPWAVCSKCGDRNVASVWERTIFPAVESEGVAAERLIGIDRVVELAASQFGRHISKQAVWQWVARGKLAPIDRETKPHQFRLSDVIDTLTEREAG